MSAPRKTLAGDRRDEAGDRRDEAGDERDNAGLERDQAGDERDAAGGERDQAGDLRDDAADLRDDAADQRDRVAERLEAVVLEGAVTGPITPSALARRAAASDRRQASRDRRAASTERAQAEDDRNTSLADRDSGANERVEAEHDRSTALSDRTASAADRDASSVDGLTGVHLRGPGFIEMERELARAQREQQPLVVVFVDVDGLKAINDTRGHAAGDRMLLEVATTMRDVLRSYDLIIRYGGDEFVCVISGLEMADAMTRLAGINDALAKTAERGSVTLGFAEMRPDDSAEKVVARADAALYLERESLARRLTPSAQEGSS